MLEDFKASLERNGVRVPDEYWSKDQDELKLRIKVELTSLIYGLDRADELATGAIRKSRKPPPSSHAPRKYSRGIDLPRGGSQQTRVASSAGSQSCKGTGGRDESDRSISGVHGLVRLMTVDLFVGLAERTYAALHLLDEPESHASLLAAGPCANRAFHAALGHGAVAVRNFDFAHGNLPRVDLSAAARTIGSCRSRQDRLPDLRFYR